MKQLRPGDRFLRGRDVRLIDQNNEQVGIVTFETALARAQQAGLDLVLVPSKTEPPVTRIMDFGKYQFEESKRAREARKNQVQPKLKEVKLRPAIDDNDPLAIIAILIILTIFGIKLVRAASTVLSIAIIVITALLVVFGLTADYDSIAAQITSQHNLQFAEYTNNVGSAIWKGVLVYAGFQCVSIPPMIAASQDLSLKGVKKAHILGWLMNGLALAASGWMLTKWYPLLASMQTAGKEFLAAGSGSPLVAYANALGIPNQTVLDLIGIKWLLIAFSVLLFCAFMSTCVTLVYTLIQRFEGKFFPKTIKSDKVRGIFVAAIVIAICFGISLLGLTDIVKFAYGYDGYYALLVIVIPAFVWGIPKIRKLEAAKKAE